MTSSSMALLVSEAMAGLEEVRLAYHKAAQALAESGLDSKLHGDLVFSLREAEQQAARLTEHVDFDGQSL